MKLSTRSRYGLKACFELALNYDKDVCSLPHLADKLAISKVYLEQLFRILIKSDIIHSVRGAQGGYKLNKEPADITIGMIIRALENEIVLADCVNGVCSERQCPTKNIWLKLDNAINSVLDSLTLKDMIDDYKNSINGD